VKRQPRNALYAQSGGVTAVINASACGVIQTARQHADLIPTVFAARNGIIGALTEDLIDTGRESEAAIDALRYTPGGAFGSCRYKLKGIDQSRAQYERLIEVFRAHDIGYFFYNGGGDSADTCLKVSQLAEMLGYPLQAIHVPKTVDNDLVATDCCPGFGSVAKYVATSILEASLDVASMSSTSTKVFVMEVMGRHAGWITAACGLPSRRAGDPPHILLFPETPFEEARFLERVRKVVDEQGQCVVAASEGVKGADGKFLAESGLKDAFGHSQLGGVATVIAGLVRDKLNLKVHWAVPDYLQRSARHLASKVDVEQAWKVGEAAVKLALNGHHAAMVTIERTSDRPYRWRTGVAKLEDVANRERKVPPEFFTDDGFHITDAARTYLEPLIRGEDPPPFRDGLPDYARLKLAPVTKRLTATFTP
jgi:6-phosphofructokinase 1